MDATAILIRDLRAEIAELKAQLEQARVSGASSVASAVESARSAAGAGAAVDSIPEDEEAAVDADGEGGDASNTTSNTTSSGASKVPRTSRLATGALFLGVKEQLLERERLLGSLDQSWDDKVQLGGGRGISTKQVCVTNLLPSDCCC